MNQPRSQGLSSSCPLGRERRDPGWVWSRVFQKNGRSKVNDSREGQISSKFVATASRGEREVLLSNKFVVDLPDSSDHGEMSSGGPPKTPKKIYKSIASGWMKITLCLASFSNC